MYLGDFEEDSTLYFCWGTNSKLGASITRATDGTIKVYKDNNTTESTTGITDTEDFDSVTGVHNCKIVLTDDFYAAGHDYSVVLVGAVIDGETVNAVLATFSIENRYVYGADILDTILTYTGETIPAMLRIIGSFVLESTTIATLASQTSFTLTDGSTDDDAYKDGMIIIQDADTDTQKAIGHISAYTGSTKTITLAADPAIFTMAVGDKIRIIATPKNIADIKKLLRADKVIDTSETPWVTDYKEEGTADVLMSKTMKNTANENITTKNNVLGRLEKE